ncbi:MAG: DUF4011 domain-containing protein [Planctomycetaceae bacterium]
MSLDVSSELNRLREKLLDLTNRNPLLNYRKTKRRTLQIVDELPNQIFDRLVAQQKIFKFSPANEISEGEFETLPIELAVSSESPEKRHQDDRLQTNLAPERLDSVLKYIQNQANSAIQETGVNYLHLAIGLLSWKESDASEAYKSSPLILIPVFIDKYFDKRRGQYAYSVRWSEEDIKFNLSLQKRLERDFGYLLPEFDQDTNPEAYFDLVEQLINGKDGWQVKRQALLGFFSFHKLLMYLDLAPELWAGADNLDGSIVESIVCGADSDDATSLYATDYEIDDDHEANQILLVSDADSSQHSALVDIASGKSLVIEGPPGSGKSQTITNAIANAIHQGKSVLFVAEKLAALKVVQDRLAKLKLDGFCLELHSEAANSRTVFESLRNRLESTYANVLDIEQRKKRLYQYRETLARYLAASSEPAGPYGTPAYEVFWRIVRLRSEGVPRLREHKIQPDVNQEEFETRKQALQSFADSMDELDNSDGGEWKGFNAYSLKPNDSELVANTLELMKAEAITIRQCYAMLEEDYGLSPAYVHDRNVPWGDCLQALSTEELALSPEHLPMLSNQSARGETIALCGELHERMVARELIDSRISCPRDEALRQISPWKHALVQLNMLSPTLSIQEAKASREWLKTAAERLNSIIEIAEKLDGRQLGPVKTLDDYQLAEKKHQLLRHPIVSGGTNLKPEYFLGEFSRQHRAASEHSRLLVSKRERVEDSFHLPSVPARAEITRLMRELRPFATHWLPWLSSRYRKAKYKLSQFWNPARRMSLRQWLQALEDLESLERDAHEFRENSAFRNIFGELFDGLDTDWERLRTLRDWTATATKFGLDYEACDELLEIRDKSSEELRSKTVTRQREEFVSWVSNHPHLRNLGLKTDELTSMPLDDVKTHLSTLETSINSFLQCGILFNANAEATICDLREYAEVLEKSEREISSAALPHWKKLLPSLEHNKEDSQALQSAAAWVQKLAEADLPPECFQRICMGHGPASLAPLVQVYKDLGSATKEWTKRRSWFEAVGESAPSWLNYEESIDTDMACLEQIELLLGSMESLPVWIESSRLRERCRSLGILGVIEGVNSSQFSHNQLPAAYELAVLEAVADRVQQSAPELNDFSRHQLGQVRSDFAEQDRALIDVNNTYIAGKAAKRVGPRGNSKGRVGELTEMSLIYHEVNKQKRHIRIRDLFARASKSVRELKPCFMMSPLSVAQYLDTGSKQFDLVIMDEASQIKPEDALGAVLRAKQLVVVGDPKQMPPTSFFDKASDEVDDEEATQLDNTESILEASMKCFQPVRRLRWHYRSKHESLIQFSNSQFYESDLVVFPSAKSDGGKLGTVHHYIENAHFNKGENCVEAEAVANAMVQHLKSGTNESLGVGTFNIKQSALIRELFEQKCESDPLARSALEDLNASSEPLFVKNLENLQGDERDVMFISFTYGPDPETGKVFKRFGPMVSEVGWRRLNVLVTRARRRIEVFASMHPSDIGGGPGKSRGVNAMRDYLDFASTGSLPDRVHFSAREPESDFEISVSRVVQSLGLETVPQVGVAGYFIDIGVLSPNSKTDFILAIECDGATYHSSKSARDRDRLREQIIRDRGWEIHRIWSTDWFQNQNHEERRLREKLDRCLADIEHQ